MSRYIRTTTDSTSAAAARLPSRRPARTCARWPARRRRPSAPRPAGNYAPSHALIWSRRRRTEPVVRRRLSQGGGHQPSRRRLRVRVRRPPRPEALIIGDPQVGSATGARGPVLGTFLVPFAGLRSTLPRPPCPGISEEGSLARPGQRQTGARRTAPQKQRRVRQRDDVVSVLARTAGEVEAAARRGHVTPAVRTKFQVVALLVREERARIRAAAGSDRRRAEQLKRLDGIATILATTAVRDTSLLALLAEDAGVSDAARSLRRRCCGTSASSLRPRRSPRRATADRARRTGAAGRAAVGDLPAAGQPVPRPRLLRRPAAHAPRPHRLAGWELLDPLLSSFEHAGGGRPGLHGAARRRRPGATPAGLRADAAPGASWSPRPRPATAPSCSPTSPAWARPPRRCSPRRRRRLPAARRRAERRQDQLGARGGLLDARTARPPSSTATATTVDGFADIVIVNYDVLDRHVGWLGDFGFRGMVVDEAHFIKNKTSQRSQHVLALSERIRSRTGAAAADGADRHPADQRHRGLPGDLAVPRLDRRRASRSAS